MSSLRTESTRTSMQEYWQNFSPSLESMMLDKTAAHITSDEQEEILSLLPDFTGKVLLELGSGIGRFTGVLARNARYLTAVDFIEEYIAANKKANSHFSNIAYISADVLDIELPKKRYDIVFSNWLLMYLSDEECLILLKKILSWLDDTGCFFFRESCFHASGNMARVTNPTFYRTPADYKNLLEAAWITKSEDYLDPSDDGFGFDVISVGSLKSYIKHKNNSFQIAFLGRKINKMANSKDSYQQFLDQKQYSKNGIRRYEWMFGGTFMSTGGLISTKKYVPLLDLECGQKVLHVGCGIGGHSFYMAENYGVEVLGIDLSVNMMTFAIEYLSERPLLKNKIKFVICDITKAEYENEAFDAIYSRDTFLHIKNKKDLFINFESWLKPGGKLFFTDYTRSDKVISADFQKYIMQRDYDLFTIEEYKEVLLSSGFTKIKIEDTTEEFLNNLNTELSRLRNMKNEFFKEFSDMDYQCLEDGWTSKIKSVRDGNQTWTSCYAEKPLNV